MKIKTSDLKGAALDWAVVKCEGDELAALNNQYPDQAKHYPKVSPSTNWTQGGPIIEREKIETLWLTDDAPDHKWGAQKPPSKYFSETFTQAGPTLLIAAMRCYVASKLGELVDVPGALL